VNPNNGLEGDGIDASHLITRTTMMYLDDVKPLIWLPKWMDSSRLVNRVLTLEPVQRALLGYSLVCTLNCLAGLGTLHWGVSLGLVDATQAHVLTAVGLALTLCHYMVVRLGWNHRFKDPTLAEPQTMMVCVLIAWGYAIGGPGRAAALPLLFSILLFCMFACTPRQVMRISAVAGVAMSAAMLTVVNAADTPHAQSMQATMFISLMLALITFNFLARQVGRVRAQNREQADSLRQAMARIQDLAMRDELTGLYNRRHMMQLAQTELKRLDRSGDRLCLCLLDLDHFKGINDQHGHGVGDEVLKAFANCLVRAVREVDVVARWGGEEFLVMLPGATPEAAAAVIERVRAQLDQQSVSRKVHGLHVRFSAGLAMRLPGEDFDCALERTDQALYAAKRAGRNNTVRAA
jgi:diguanylate cyclase (GGDEF)-like protein